MLSDLASIGAHGEAGHLFRELWSATFGDRPAEERRMLLGRLMRAYSDEAIASVFWPKVN